MCRKIWLWGLALCCWTAGQSQVVTDNAVLDSVSTLLAAERYQEVVDLLQGESRSGEAEHLLGLAYLNLGRYELAVSQGDRAVALGNGLGYLLKGDAYTLSMELDSALVAYNQAVDALPGNPDGLRRRGLLYASRGELALSDADFKTVLERDTTDRVALWGLAQNAYDVEDYDKGVRYLDALELVSPNFAGLFTLRAHCHLYMNRLEEAADDAAVALRLGDSDGFSLLVAIGNLDNELVMRLAQEAAAQFPSEFMWPYLQGVLDMGSLRYREAIPLLQEAHRLCPSGAVCEQVAKCYEVLGWFAEGVTAIDEAIKLEPDEHRYYKLRMRLLAYSGRVDEAIAQGERFLNVQPDDVECYNFLGYLCYWQRKWEAAESFVSMGIGLDQSFAPMYVLRGMIRKSKGDEAGAKMDFETALERYGGCNTIASKYHAYAGLGLIDQGVAALEVYLGTENNEAEAFYDGACFYARIGEKEKAIEMLEEATRRGFCQCALLHHDPDLECLKDDTRFMELLHGLELTYHFQE